MKNCHLLEGVLGSSENRYRSIVEEQTELICRFLPDGTLTFVNKSFCCYFGKESESPIGQNFFQLILPAEGEANCRHLLSLNAEHPVAICERQMHCASGDVRWQQWTDKGIFDRAGQLVEFQSVGRDITASKLLKQHDLELLNLLVRAVKDSAIYLLDVGGRIVSWNRGAQNIYGFSEAEIVGQHFSGLFPHELVRQGQSADYLLQAQNQGFYEVESKRVRADGSEFWVNAAIAPLRDNSGKICGFAEAVRDITDSLNAAEILTEIQAKYQTVLQICPAGIVIADASGNICETNPAAELILGKSNSHQDLFECNIFEWQMRSDNGTPIANSESAIARSIASKKMVDNVETEIVKANGETVRARVTAAPIELASGGTAIAIADISTLKRQEESIHYLEQELEVLLENTPDIVAKFDKNLRQYPAKSKAKTALELLNKEIDSSPEEWEIPAETEQIWHQAIQTAWATGRQQVTELERSIAGEIKCYQARLVPQFAKDGSVASVLALARDKAQSQRTQPTFGQQKEFLQTIFDCLPVMVAFCTEAGELLSVNREWERVMGWSYLEAANRDLLAECYPNLADRQIFAETIARSDGTWHEFQTQVRDGSVADIAWASFRLSDGTRIAIGQNLIERKQAEAALRASEERFSATFDQAAVGMVTFLPNGRCFRINQKFCDIVGYDRAELLAKTYFEITHPEDLEADLAFARSLYAGDIANYSIEKRYIRKDGLPIWVNLSASLVRNSEGIPQYTLAVVEDISVRKQVEANLERAYNSLQEREELYRTLTTHAPVGIFQTNAEGEITFVNEQWCEIAGMTREQVIDNGWREALHPEDWERLRAMQEIPQRQRRQQAGQKNGGGEMLAAETLRPIEYRFVAPDGKISWAMGNSSPLRDTKGKFQGIIGTLLDISDRKKAEERLAKINECFLEFSGDPTENINRLTALCGELLGASCALYNRLQGEMLCSLGQWYAEGECHRELGAAAEICHAAIQAGTDELLVIRDLTEGGAGGDERLHTYLAQPVKCQNIGVGALCAAYRSNLMPSEDERRVMGIIAGAIGVEEERLRVEEALRLQTERERLMGAIAQRVRQSLDMEAILNTTVAEVRQFLDCDRVAIFCLGAGGTSKVMTEAVAPEWPTLLGESFPKDCFPRNLYSPKIAADRIVAEGASNPVNDCFNDFLEQMGIVSKLVVPILNSERWRSRGRGEDAGQGRSGDGDSFWGLLVAHHDVKSRQWQEWEVQWLSALATQAGIAIEQSQLYEQLKAANHELHRQATVDGLTQVANRRRFDEYLVQEWRRLARYQAPISLIMCDVDFFKRYNDGHGHLAGDDCLKQVAAAIAGALKRPADLAARYGGEEFAVILPHTDAAGAFCVAEEIRSRVFGLQIPHGNSAVNSCVTMSLGVATAVPVPLSAPEELIAAADGALYCAKERGRDRVIQKVIAHWELGIGNG
jgi:diguanylate cyclase (GGDEF)-like protein/PAS domain S-box-containing protein